MRTDVKVGIALGAIVLVIAVSYYGTKKDGDIELADSAKQVEEHNSKVLDQFLGAPQGPATDLPSKSRARKTPTRDPSPERRPAADRSLDSRSPAKPPASTRPEVQTPVAVEASPPGIPEASDVVQNRPILDPPGAARSGLPATRSGGVRPAESTLPALPPAGPTAASVRELPRTNSAPTTDPPGTRQHEIQSGDSFAFLADQYYGSQRHAQFLAQSNPSVDPHRMKVGSKLQIPPLPEALSTPSAVPGATRPPTLDKNHYQVQPGDTFYGIAEAKLGAGGRWREIYDLNKSQVQDPDKLKVGQVLQLPAG